MTDLALKAPSSPFLVVLDEMGYYFGNQNDGLKEALRDIEGVPNARHLVQGDRVFVFAKLVALVAPQYNASGGSKMYKADLAELALSQMPNAYMSASEAVQSWEIVPVPYEMIKLPAGGFMIRHCPLNARLAATFETKEDVQAVFVNILLGGFQPGHGDFVYRGQSLVLCAPLDPLGLPYAPEISGALPAEPWYYTSLGGAKCNFVPGFEPVTLTRFATTAALEDAWKNASARAVRHARNNAEQLWTRIGELDLGSLNNPADQVAEYGQDDFLELKPLYPEMAMFSDGSLYNLFDAYQSDCCDLRGWTANRDDGFLFYLLGVKADTVFTGEYTVEAGAWAAFALLRGDTLDDALKFACAAAVYDRAISQMASQIARAMRFLEDDQKTTDQRGHTISTMMDCFRLGRKFNIATPLVAEQNLSDFIS